LAGEGIQTNNGAKGSRRGKKLCYPESKEKKDGEGHNTNPNLKMSVKKTRDPSHCQGQPEKKDRAERLGGQARKGRKGGGKTENGKICTPGF